MIINISEKKYQMTLNNIKIIKNPELILTLLINTRILTNKIYKNNSYLKFFSNNNIILPTILVTVVLLLITIILNCLTKMEVIIIILNKINI